MIRDRAGRADLETSTNPGDTVVRSTTVGRCLDHRNTRWRVAAVLGLVVAGGCVSDPESAPSGDSPVLDSTAGDPAAALLAAATRQAGEPLRGEVRREVDFQSVLGSRAPVAIEERSPAEAAAAVRALADARVDLSIAATAPTSDGGSPSRQTTRNYLLGRTSLAEGRPMDALAPLVAAARAGGGAAAWRAVAEAADLAGRTAQAVEARLELARRGEIGRRDRDRLVESLLARGDLPRAMAVQAAGVASEFDGEQGRGLAEACRFLELVELAGERRVAAQGRADLQVLRLADHFGKRMDSGPLRRFLVAFGDDAARRGRLEVAAECWRSAEQGGVGADPSLRLRRLLVEAALGRDLVVQGLLFEDAEAPTEAALAAARAWREQDLSFDLLSAALARRCRVPDRLEGPLGLLVAVDPDAAARVLAELAGRRDAAAIRPLVEAAFEAGVESAVATAVALGTDPASVDLAVDALLDGPVPSEPLLAAAVDAVAVEASGSSVLAEVFRRHGRPELALSRLREIEATTPAARVAILRAAADLADPMAVLAVPDVPFDAIVERERIAALLAAGEPELADALARSLLARDEVDPALRSVAAEAIARGPNALLEAIDEAAKAIEGGDDALAARIRLATLAARVEDPGRLPRTVTRLLASLPDDPTFAAILASDAAMASGSATQAIERLEPWLVDRDARDAVLVRLLAAWRAAGRLPEGRRRLEAMRERHPADPSIGDALFALERTLDGPRDAAIGLREKADRGLDGLPERRLEMVLGEIPESREEWRRRVSTRLDRAPEGIARDVQRLGLAVESGSSPEAALGSLEAADFGGLTPRLRRRLATLAAASATPRGEGIVRDIAAAVRDGDRNLDVDTAIAIASATSPPEFRTAIDGLAPAPPWTDQDPTWQSRVALFAARDLPAAFEVAEFGLRRPPAVGEGGGLLRTAAALSMLADRSAADTLDLVDVAVSRGWSVEEAWPDGEAGDLRRLQAIASDASLLGRESVALALMELVVDERPDDATALNNLGYALIDLGEFERADRLVRDALAIEPDSPSTLDSLGWLGIRRHLEEVRDGDGDGDGVDLDRCLDLIRRSIGLRIDEGRTPSSEVLLHLGDAEWLAGDRDVAMQIWQQLAAREDASARRARLAGIRRYQQDVWGGELVPSGRIGDLLEGRWADAARARLDAVGRDQDPFDRAKAAPPEEGA